MAATSDTRPRLIAFPKERVPYNVCLYAAAERLDIPVVEGMWAGRWLLANVRRGDFLHIHWPSFLYFREEFPDRTPAGIARFITFVYMLKMRGARIIWTVHNLYPHDGGRDVLEHRIGRRVMARVADFVLAHGPTAADLVAKEFGITRSKIHVVKHGHWMDFHANTMSSCEAREALHIAPDDFVYSFVGACKPYKNLEFLIETFAQLDDKSILVIAGRFQSDEYRARIESLLEGLPRDRWRFAPRFVPNDEVQRYVLAANALVLPYTEILTSGAAMLGLSFGRPIIAPDAGGLKDTIGPEYGILYDRTEPGQLLCALKSVRTRPFSETAIMQFAATFDWMESARTIAEIVGG
jgi:beta-1,4-mannosyltransferase